MAVTSALQLAANSPVTVANVKVDSMKYRIFRNLNRSGEYIAQVAVDYKPQDQANYLKSAENMCVNTHCNASVVPFFVIWIAVLLLL